MPTMVWILVWVAVIGIVVFLAIREIRSGRKQPAEFDRFQHEAVREAGMNQETRGPRGVGGVSGFGGF